MNAQAVEIKTIAGRQTIALPDDMTIEDNMVYVKKEGNVVHLIPFHNPWQPLIDSLSEFTPDFMARREQPGNQAREYFD